MLSVDLLVGRRQKNTRRALLNVFAAICLSLSLFAQQAAAFTINDFRCTQQGGSGGTCFYDPGSVCTSGNVPTSGSGRSDQAIFPSLDPTAMAQSIDNFIQKENPNSELKGLGATIVASARNSNINPFLIVAIAHEESSLADPSDYNVSHGNNSFGREATSSQPHFNGSHLWYKWSSVKASVDYLAPENKNAQGGGDIAAYLRDQYGNTIDGSSLLSLFMKYAPPNENNTTQYTSNVEGWINDMVNGSGGANASSQNQDQASPCACSSSGSSLVGGDNQEKIFNYFTGKGLTAAQSAGIDGNFGQESGWNPSDSGGYLAQWGGSRLTALQQLAQKENKPVTDLGVQLDYVWLELTNSSGAGEDDSKVLKDLKATTTAADAATVFSNEYERPSDPQLQNRIDYANQILAKYGANSSTTQTPSSCGVAAVNCSSVVPADASLSQTRKNVVCIAQQELAAWNSGNMKPGFRPNSSDSFSKYSQNSDELWCADFASWVYQQAGYPLQPAPEWRVPGVQSIQSIGDKNGNFHWHDAGSYTPKPGDLAVYGGTHVNIVTEVNGTTMTVLGGDQSPDIPNGWPDHSRVSSYPINGFSGGGITGYVTPD